MTKKISRPVVLSRRKILINAGTAILAAPLLSLTACQGDSSSDDTTSSTEDTSDTEETEVTEDTEESVDETTTEEVATGWVSGGTDLISVEYPNDSLFASAGTCALTLTEATTEGPCYFGVSELEDISGGYTGLPMMLCLQLVDRDCNPLQGYLVEVWHCDKEGVYSGDTTNSDDDSTFAGSFCTGGDTEAEASTWFRGEQTSNSSGRVNFKSCFPGWYRGRTIHIHFRIRLEYGGSDFVISQFCFDDDFAEEICTTHDLYLSRGVQDTTLASGSDTVFPSSDYSDYQLNVQQNIDGTLLAFKQIMIDVS